MTGESAVINGGREQAWKDTLTTDELGRIERLSGMPPAMASAYSYIETRRDIQELRAEVREMGSSRKGLVQTMGAGFTGAFLTALGFVAHALGWDEAIK